MLQNIINGQCPHVREMPVEYAVKIQCVTALYIAAAVNTKQAVEQSDRQEFASVVGIQTGAIHGSNSKETTF